MPRRAPIQDRRGVSSPHHAMAMRYHGAEVKRSMDASVMSLLLTASSAAWYAMPSTAKEMMRS